MRVESRIRTVLAVLMASLFLEPVAAQRATDKAGGPVVVMTIDGPIMPPTREYYERGLRQAEREGATCLLVEMDTPGGMLTTMREIASMNLEARVPVVVYIAPAGARAGSAGAVIALSADIIAMAPGTNIGAAHPVTGSGADIEKDMRDKVTNDTAAFARGLAERRHKPIQWSEDIIRKSISSTATEASQLKVADILADNRQDLLNKLDGRHAETAAGTQTLQTVGARVEQANPTWGETFLGFLFNPTIAVILWMCAIYGIIAEFNHPGAILPGVAGALCLVLALFCMSALSASATGIALLLLSVALFIIDLYATTHGVLTAGGVIAFIVGAMLLFNPAAIGVAVSLPVVVALGLLTALFFGIIISAAVRIRRRKPVDGPEAIVGMLGVARAPINPTGRVFLQGAWWSAVNTGAEPIEKGDPILVEGRDGLTLKIRRAEHAPAEPIWSAKA